MYSAEDLKNRMIFKCRNTELLKNKISQEIFTRIFKPLYIPLLALIGGLLLIKSKNSQGYSNFKLKIFLLGVFVVSVSEISTKFYSINLGETIFIFLMPFIIFFLLYQFFKKQSKFTFYGI